MANFWDQDQIVAPAAEFWKQDPVAAPTAAPAAVAPEQPMSTGMDVAASLGSGAVRGATELPMLPLSVGRLYGEGLNWSADTIENAVRRALGFDPLLEGASDRPSIINEALFGAQDAVRGGVDSVLHEPQTTAGEYAETVGEFAAPGGIAGRAVRAAPNAAARVGAYAGDLWGNVVVPGVASETAGQLTEGTAAEPVARILGALGGNVATAASRSYNAPERTVRRATSDMTDADWQRALDIQNNQTGIQVTGPEAIAQATGGASALPNLQRVVEGSVDGRRVTAPFFAQRPNQVDAAVVGWLDNIAPQSAQPSVLGPRVAEAADTAIDQVRQDINAQTRPLYQAAEQHLLLPQTSPIPRTPLEINDNAKFSMGNVFRGVEGGTDAQSAIRVFKGGDLGDGVYVTLDEGVAKSYGGGPRSSVTDESRVVHSYGLNDLYPEDVAFVFGARTHGDPVRIVSGNGIELWSGEWSNANMEAALRQHPDIKLVVGTPDSVGVHQIAVRDPSIIKPQTSGQSAIAELADPRFQAGLQRLRNNPEMAPDYAAFPDNSVGMVDAVSKDLFARGEAMSTRAHPLYGPEQGMRSTAAASNVRDLARDPARGGSAEYNAALEQQTQLRRDVLEPVTEGPVGRVAASSTTADAGNALMPLNPLTGSGDETADAVVRLLAQDAESTTGLVRQTLGDRYNRAGTETMEGAREFAGAKFHRDVSGNPARREVLDSVIGSLPAQNAAAMDELLDVLQATGRRKPVGSATAFNQSEIAALGTASPTGQMWDFISSLGSKLVTRGGDAIKRRALHGNLAALAEMFIDPQSVDVLRAAIARGAPTTFPEAGARTAAQSAPLVDAGGPELLESGADDPAQGQNDQQYNDYRPEHSARPPVKNVIPDRVSSNSSDEINSDVELLIALTQQALSQRNDIAADVGNSKPTDMDLMGALTSKVLGPPQPYTPPQSLEKGDAPPIFNQRYPAPEPAPVRDPAGDPETRVGNAFDEIPPDDVALALEMLRRLFKPPEGPFRNPYPVTGSIGAR